MYPKGFVCIGARHVPRHRFRAPSPPARVGSLPADLEAYHEFFAPLYPRREQAASARRYLLGLLSDEPRKSVERMALKLQGPDRNAVRSRQQFVGESSWSDTPLLARLWAEVGATLGEEEGMLIVDGSDRSVARDTVPRAASDTMASRKPPFRLDF